MGKFVLSALIAIVAVGLFASLRQVHAESSYTVQSGDSLSSIAQDQLGDYTKWGDIYNLNKNQISDPNLIYAGQDLGLPTKESVKAVPLYGSVRSQNVVSQTVTEKESPYGTYSYTYNTQRSSTNYGSGASIYRDIINQAASKYANLMDPSALASLMNSIIACESGFNPNAYNTSSGASGIAQYMPGTWNSSANPYRNQSIFDPIAQINYMAQMIAHGGANAWACYTMHR